MRTCKLCSGTGILYDRDAKSPTFNELAICPCVMKKCTCGGIAPFQAFDENGGHGWCSCRSARMKLAGAKKSVPRISDSPEVPLEVHRRFQEDKLGGGNAGRHDFGHTGHSFKG